MPFQKIWSVISSLDVCVDPESLTRYPGFRSPQGILRSLDWLGTVSLATTGALTAGHSGMNAMGCTIVGSITALGGGTIRDILIGSFPVYWMIETEYLILSIGTCLLTFFYWNQLSKANMVKEKGPTLYWTDTIGLGAFCVIGAQSGLRLGLDPIVCALLGMVTANFGGIIRDVLCKRPARILYSLTEIYATCALAGAVAYLMARRLVPAPDWVGVPIATGVLTTALLRYWATKQHVMLPTAPWKVQQAITKSMRYAGFFKKKKVEPAEVEEGS